MIRPFAVGRNNWLFADTVKGAEASAALYSLIVMARANKLNSFLYLKAVFSLIPSFFSYEKCHGRLAILLRTLSPAVLISDLIGLRQLPTSLTMLVE